MTAPPPMVSHVCSALLGLPARSAERLKAGSRTAVYRASVRDGRSVIVKLYAHTARRNALTEATAMRAAAAAVPVPKILGCGTTNSEGASALITADLGRSTLGAAVRSGRVPRDQALKELGGLLSRLHRVPVAKPVPRRPFVDAVSSLSRRCPGELIDRIAPAISVIANTPDSAPTVWCHGDPHLDNVIPSGSQQARHLVDFTDSAPGRRESDIAHALVMTAAHAPWERHALTAAYTLALDETLLSAWTVFVTVRSWAHATPGTERALWSVRLAELTHRTPHFFNGPLTEWSPS
ncbi:phosphotransferase family protein [Streptomyces boluensis]|uniref:Phosphotransferase n=1 Tax=Streptomyces boluensis TaxID=1775135 RepID=A0A964UMY8_9ACTN|nr:aminoglycoside phosphotransferase family protein [Streptomyces boluensis]NBE49892.1 phosphotransferase [Streptomyces boluensis]